MKYTIPKEELMYEGTVDCQGCGASLAMRYALKALGKKTMIVIPACCWSVIAGPFPYSALQVPVYHTAFETAAIASSGLKAALDVKGVDANVVAWAGDGGTFDIGIQALSGAAERNEDIIYVCYDNEAYMNTGIQRSSATPYKSWTTTTPTEHPKAMPKKDIDDIMVAHKIPYLATASVAYPEDFIAKMKKAKDIKGTKFIHILAPCPTGWRSLPEYTIKLARLAVQTNIFPLYEVEDGKYTINKKPKNPKPVGEYLKLQGRFKHLKEKDVKDIQEATDKKWKEILKKEEIKDV
ncbi:MAG: 3-methyl-2-oxobutanoate dehydrogenase subunit beta [Euryarchaeota archaeon]|nr:3-methyl-2-oxobutanoate dehydrogenase subunit beta [Euryarchaeota archaeon]